MKKFTLIGLIIFGSGISLYGQYLSKVDERVSEYESLNLRTVEKLAEQIKNDFTTDLEKARATYAWIAMNVVYDVEAYRKGTNRFNYTYKSKEDQIIKEEQRKKKVANYTFNKRKGVCDGYANLFQYLSEQVGVESVIVTGYSKTKISDIGKSPTKTDHAWNAVKINNDWLLIDATWGAGYVNGNEFFPNYSPIYFNTPADKFDLKHYPSDSKYLFSGISKKKFVNSPLFYRNYMESNFRIESPDEGILRVKPGKEITIKIVSDTIPCGITYAFSRDKYSSRLKFEDSGKYFEAKIPVPQVKSSSLTLYYWKHGMICYKLQY